MLDYKMVNWMIKSIPNINHIYRAFDKDLMEDVVSYEIKETVDVINSYYARHKQVPSYDVIRNVLVEADKDYNAVIKIAQSETSDKEIGFVNDKSKERYNR